MKPMKAIVAASSWLGLLQAQPKPRFEIRVFERKSPPAPQPEPGDSVRIDGSTGDIVAVSRGVTIRFPHRALQIKPRVEFSLTETSPTTQRLEYRLTNQAGATLQIGGIILEGGRFGAPEWSLPGGWASFSTNPPSEPPRVLITKVTPDSDPRLGAGESVAFSAVGSTLPGIVRVRITPELSRVFKAGDLTDGQFLDGASEWVRLRVDELDTPDRREARLFAIGPKVAIGEDSLAKIVDELREAAGSSDVAANNREAFLALAQRSPSSEDLRASVSRQPLSTPLELVLRQALLLRLNRLGNR